MPVEQLLSILTCPHCWHEFRATELRSVAEHVGLMGDAVAGATEPLRFLPSRFDAVGRAIDPMGVVCSRYACPRCHLEIPALALESKQTILSIVGAPASGKSVMLAATTFAMRSGMVVPGLEFVDADPTLNELTRELERSLFRADAPDRPAMVERTDAGFGERTYRRFRTGDAEYLAPRPQIFSIRRGGVQRLLCLYDNAGEHFMPGRDTPSAPVTRHLSASQAIIFVVDPTQDRRVQDRLGDPDLVLERGGGGWDVHSPDVVLIEAANRIRKTRKMSTSDGIRIPTIIALTKADLWARELLAEERASNPWRSEEHPGIAMPPLAHLDRVHEACLRFLRSTMPELVATARAIDPAFRFVPLSALGQPPLRREFVEGGSRCTIRPRDVQPAWPAGALVMALAAAEPSLLPEWRGGVQEPVGA